jgi:hypothetical protein
MKLGPWEAWTDVVAVRESDIRIPYTEFKRSRLSFPAIRMVVRGQPTLLPIYKEDEVYEVILEDSEYGIKTNYGDNLSSIELAKFTADVKLIELGYEIEEPFLLGDKND